LPTHAFKWTLCLLIAGAAACSQGGLQGSGKRDASAGPETSDSDGGIFGADGLAEVGHDSAASPADSDASGPCTSLKNSAAVLLESVNLSSPLQAYSGGTILDGTYELSGIKVWINGVTSGDLGTTQRTIRVSNGGRYVEFVFHSTGQVAQQPDFNATGALSGTGTTLSVKYDCGAGMAGVDYYYSVVGDVLVLYNWDAQGRSEYVATYQMVGIAPADGSIGRETGGGPG
jgi:hypothetical protein